MNWSKSILLAFLFFAIFIALLVAVCMKQSISLVSSQYYKDDLHYQKELESISNANALSERPEVIIVGDSVILLYSKWQQVTRGDLSIQRPSDESLDKKYLFQSLPSEKAAWPASKMPTGLYKIKLQWEENGVRFCINKSVVV
jgi:hypothetical protein